MKVILICLLIVVIIVGLMFGTGVLDLKFFGWYAPQKANIQREVFKNTKSYNEGMARDLAKIKAELQKEKGAEGLSARKALVEQVVEDYANFDATRLEVASLRLFLENIQAGRTQQYIDGEDK